MTSYFYTYNAIFDAPVSGAAKLAYAYLCKCAGMGDKCYPSHRTIAAAAGVGVTTVKKALAELERARLITIQGQARPDRGRRTNIYMIIKEAVKGFFVTYGNIFMEKLTSKARLVYLYFCRLASGRNTAFPAHRTTAAACGLSVSGARLAIDELEAAGLVSRQAQYRDNGGQKSNLYTLTAPETENDNTEPRAPEIHDVQQAPDPRAYSSSNNTSSSSGKSNNCETVMPNPCDTRCSVRNPGLFVFPFIILSNVDCFMPESVASLFSVMPRSLQRLKIRFAIASEYVIALTSLTRKWLIPLYWFVASKVTRARLTVKACCDIITHVWVIRQKKTPITQGRGRSVSL